MCSPIIAYLISAVPKGLANQGVRLDVTHANPNVIVATTADLVKITAVLTEKSRSVVNHAKLKFAAIHAKTDVANLKRINVANPKMTAVIHANHVIPVSIH
jgi:hypothetical protein